MQSSKYRLDIFIAASIIWSLSVNFLVCNEWTNLDIYILDLVNIFRKLRLSLDP